jgi:hypothetical protein
VEQGGIPEGPYLGLPETVCAGAPPSPPRPSVDLYQPIVLDTWAPPDDDPGSAPDPGGQPADPTTGAGDIVAVGCTTSSRGAGPGAILWALLALRLRPRRCRRTAAAERRNVTTTRCRADRTEFCANLLL